MRWPRSPANPAASASLQRLFMPGSYRARGAEMVAVAVEPFVLRAEVPAGHAQDRHGRHGLGAREARAAFEVAGEELVHARDLGFGREGVEELVHGNEHRLRHHADVRLE